ncbi:MAG TPA: hypothetical protein VFQ23_02590 [Anaerolineales bacterium]|nr:hypothetical protein [Anaerolineales bacterium]
MKNQDVLTKGLAVVGTALVWIPILAPILFSAALWFAEKVWRIDYLMPAELFLLSLTGGGLLIWATIRAHSHQKIIGWPLAIAVFLLVGGQVVAEVTGLASGAVEPSGWKWGFILACLVGFSIALLTMGIGGVLLVHKLFKRDEFLHQLR